MRLKILGNGGNAQADMYTTSALLNGTVALDVGTGFHKLQPSQVLPVQDAMISHAHLDHVAMLCFWVDLQAINGNNVTVHCLPETAEAIREGLFNGNIWPDMEKIKINGKPALSFNLLTPFKKFTVADGIDITPLPVMHGIPTLGFCLHGDEENFVFCSDMIDAPDEFWAYLAKLKNFNRMTMEISFPSDMDKIAVASNHLTPATLGKLLKKLPEQVQVLYTHNKIAHAETIRREVYDTLHPRVYGLVQDEELVL